MYFGKRYQNAASDEEEKGAERRTVLRRHLIYYLRVWDVKEDQLLGHIVDINTDGLMLISEKPIPTKQAFELEIRWSTPDGDTQKLTFKAQSRWSNNDINAAFYDTGFQLIDPDDDVLDPIKEMISEYGFGD